MSQAGTFPIECTPDLLAADLNDISEQKSWGRLVSATPGEPSFELYDDEIRIGRKPECQVQRSEGTVSGLHCKLTKKDNLVFLDDCSTNGTYLGPPSAPKKIGKGTRVVLGNNDQIHLIPRAVDKNGQPKHTPISYYIYFYDSNWRNMNHFQRKWDIRHTLGNGAFAEVKFAVNRDTGDHVAAKIVDKKKYKINTSSTRPNALKDEVEILSKLNHPNIVKVYEAHEDDDHYTIILELVEGGDLFDAISAEKPEHRVTPDQARGIMYRLLLALQYLHNNHFVHRDLKPENILMVTRGGEEIKVSDFGLSRSAQSGVPMQTICGTPQYLAPEIIQTTHKKVDGYTKAVDVWSAGCILYVMLSGNYPFPEPVLDNIMAGNLKFPAAIWQHHSTRAQHLIKRMLTLDPAKRISIEEALNDPYFASLAAQLGPSLSTSSSSSASSSNSSSSSSSSAATASPASAPGAHKRKQDAVRNGDAPNNIKTMKDVDEPDDADEEDEKHQNGSKKRARNSLPSLVARVRSGDGDDDEKASGSLPPGVASMMGRVQLATNLSTVNENGADVEMAN